jgi:hypothetical protein
MRKALQILSVSIGVIALVLSGTAVASAKATSPRAYRCTGGDIPSGRYADIRVTGACAVAADAVISVAGDVFVGNGAVLDAQSAPSTITVGGNVTAVKGSLLGLGCQPNTTTAKHPCAVEPSGHSTITIHGNVTTLGADTVLLNGITVRGNVSLAGGGGANPWSVKNDTIRGNLTIIGVTTEFVVLLRNIIGGSATLIDITETDTDPDPAVEVAVNTIGRNLICFGLSPRAAGGTIPGQVNVVRGHAIGQCASLV